MCWSPDVFDTSLDVFDASFALCCKLGILEVGATGRRLLCEWGFEELAAHIGMVDSPIALWVRVFFD